MSTFASGEIRWFLAGAVPAAVDTWFARGGDGRRAAPRVDEYLVLPDGETASLKLREGRLELKYRIASPQPVHFGSRVAGRRDGWRKWSRKSTDAESLRSLVAGAADEWLAVEKERRLRKVALTDDGMREVDGAAFPERGCGIELTAIRAGIGNRTAEPWWSIAFEAFGTDPRLALADVERVAAAWFTEPPPFELPESHSLAYPEWLALLV